MFTVLALISGRGSNLLNLIKRSDGFTVAGILSDNPDAPGLNYGKEYGIESHIVDARSFPTKREFRAALLTKVRELKFDLICLAGFMQILDREFVESFYGRLINIHPSLLPALPGLNTHERAISEGRAKHGCTVHYVDSGVDTGPIIAQKEVAVLKDDSVQALFARVLEQEHRLYPWVVKQIALGQIGLKQQTVQISDTCRKEANELGFLVSQGLS